MRLRQYLQLYEAFVLAEATKYDNMFAALSGLMSADAQAKGQPGNTSWPIINWAQQKLKREDRIIWFLRWWRLLFLHVVIQQADTMRGDPKVQASMEPYRALYDKYFREMSKITGQPLDPKDPSGMLASTRRNDSIGFLQDRIPHFLSLPIPAMQQIQFSNQTPAGLFQQFDALEKQWQEQIQQEKQHLQPQQGDEILIPFNDGWAWWLLARGSCPLEADAMGHCGNAPSEVSGDRILSLRKQGPKGWRPSLTFILHGDGMLGEMKGRNNDKPQPQYHPYIVKLLENPIIKGIVGGGYAPENNFQLNDLPEEEQDRLATLKPAFATATYLFRKYGPTDEFGAKAVQEIGNQLDRDVSWDNQRQVFVIERFKNVDGFLDLYGSDFTNELSAEFSGEGRDIFDRHGYIDTNEIENLFLKLPPDLLQAICAYEYDKYGDVNEYEDYEGTAWDDPREVINVIEREEDDIYSELYNAVATGERYGAEREAYETFTSTLMDPFTDPNDRALSMHYTMFTDHQGKQQIDFEKPCEIVMDAKDMVMLLNSPEALHQVYDEGWVTERVKVEEPHYGWSGYDEQAAIEQATDMLSDIVGHRSAPQQTQAGQGVAAPLQGETPTAAAPY